MRKESSLEFDVPARHHLKNARRRCAAAGVHSSPRASRRGPPRTPRASSRHIRTAGAKRFHRTHDERRRRVGRRGRRDFMGGGTSPETYRRARVRFRSYRVHGRERPAARARVQTGAHQGVPPPRGARRRVVGAAERDRGVQATSTSRSGIRKDARSRAGSRARRDGARGRSGVLRRASGGVRRGLRRRALRAHHGRREPARWARARDGPVEGVIEFRCKVPAAAGRTAGAHAGCEATGGHAFPRTAARRAGPVRR